MTEEKRKAGRPFKADKKKYQVIRIEKSLDSELEKYLPVYSKKVNFKVTKTYETYDQEKFQITKGSILPCMSI